MEDQSCCFSLSIGDHKPNRYGKWSANYVRALVSEYAKDFVIIKERFCELGLKYIQIGPHRHHHDSLADRLFNTQVCFWIGFTRAQRPLDQAAATKGSILDGKNSTIAMGTPRLG
jgi:hypothetical protein